MKQTMSNIELWFLAKQKKLKDTFLENKKYKLYKITELKTTPMVG